MKVFRIFHRFLFHYFYFAFRSILNALSQYYDRSLFSHSTYMYMQTYPPTALSVCHSLPFCVCVCLSLYLTPSLSFSLYLPPLSPPSLLLSLYICIHIYIYLSSSIYLSFFSVTLTLSLCYLIILLYSSFIFLTIPLSSYTSSSHLFLIQDMVGRIRAGKAQQLISGLSRRRNFMSIWARLLVTR